MSFSENDLKAQMPGLQGFAFSLTRNHDAAFDLVQETLLKAWEHKRSFKPGTNLKAWLFVILRNAHFSVYRKRKREVSLDDEHEDGTSKYSGPVQPSNQEDALYLSQVLEAFSVLTAEQLLALNLIRVGEMSYAEAACVMNVAIGTVKSRVNRASNTLCVHLKEEIPVTRRIQRHRKPEPKPDQKIVIFSATETADDAPF